MEKGYASQVLAPVDPRDGTPHRLPMISELVNDLKQHGLMLRGGFHPIDDDTVPRGVRTVMMIGNAGPDLWRAFSSAAPDAPNPLDNWTKSIIDPIAGTYGARAIYPFTGPPYFPFQRWAQLADDVHPSPIGPLIHPTYGLWHAYRAALLFQDDAPLPPMVRTRAPCEACDDRPCLATCPVSALTDGAYDVPSCRVHIGSDAGSDCLEGGCLARRACPVGQDFIYEPAQAEFHMRSFLGA